MKKTIRIIYSLLVAVSLVVGFLPAIAIAKDEFVPGSSQIGGIMARGTPDSNPPKLVSVSIDKTEVESGSKIRVTAEGTDDISGVGHIDCSFENRQTGRGHGAHCTFSEKTGKYEGEIILSQYDFGVYNLYVVNVVDKAGNSQKYYSKNYESPDEEFLKTAEHIPQELSFTVKGGIVDTTPPELTSISIDKTKAKIGDTICITANGTDDISGIQHINLSFTNTKTNKDYLVGCKFSKESEKWEGKITISQYDLGGVYELNWADIKDKAGNSQYYCSKNSEILTEGYKRFTQELSFTVISDITDIAPPELISVSIDKTKVETPGTIFVTVKAVDDISGIDDIWCHFENRKNGKDLSAVCSFSEESGKYEGKITISQYDLGGIYDLDRVALHDNAGNSQIYYSKNYVGDDIPTAAKLLPNELSFTVRTDSEDSGPNNPNQGNTPNAPNNPIPGNTDNMNSSSSSVQNSSTDSHSSARKESASGNNSSKTQVSAPISFRTSTALPGIRAAVRGAVKRGETAGVTVRVPDISRISVTELSALQRALRKESLPVRLQFTRTGTSDSLTFSPLDISPAAAVQLGLRQGDAQVSALFGKYFKNRIRVLCFSQKGTFGTPVRVRTKFSLSGLDPKTLVFYHYDKEKNQYTLLTNPQYAVDQNGILSFTTETGGTLVITDAPLTKK